MRRTACGTLRASPGAHSRCSKKNSKRLARRWHAGRNQRLEKEPHETVPLVRAQLGEVEHGRDLGLAQLAGEQGSGTRVSRHVATLSGADNQVVLLAQGRELALRVDHELLHTPSGLLKQSPDRPRFAASRIRLHEHACLEQSRQINLRIAAVRKNAKSWLVQVYWPPDAL